MLRKFKQCIVCWWRGKGGEIISWESIIKKGRLTVWLALVLIPVVGLWALTPRITQFVWGKGVNSIGEVGDLYGSYGALVSALAFVGLIFTIIQQQYQIKLQADELRQNTEELSLQRKVLAGQLLTAKLTTKIGLKQDEIKRLATQIAMEQANPKDFGSTVNRYLSFSFDGIETEKRNLTGVNQPPLKSGSRPERLFTLWTQLEKAKRNLESLGFELDRSDDT
jgi:uncharacterized membrane protein